MRAGLVLAFAALLFASAMAQVCRRWCVSRACDRVSIDLCARSASMRALCGGGHHVAGSFRMYRQDQLDLRVVRAIGCVIDRCSWRRIVVVSPSVLLPNRSALLVGALVPGVSSWLAFGRK